MKIAIDGGSGAGKSTVSKALSKKLGIMYLDTGAMYRAVALRAIKCGIMHTNFGVDDSQIDEFLKSTTIDIRYEDGNQVVLLDGINVSAEIREHFVSAAASNISANPKVRIFLVDMQRKIAAKSDCVLDGRDIGTFVLPDADFKFFLTASLEERARRRHLELKEKGQGIPYERILEDIEKRDLNDMSRAFAPLKKAADAMEIDTTFLTPDEVVGIMSTVINKERG